MAQSFSGRRTRLGRAHVHACVLASFPLSLLPLQLEVQCPPGVPIGFVREHWNLCRAVYSIQNEKRENVMRVRGPCSTYGCGSDSVFEVGPRAVLPVLRAPAGLGVLWFGFT